MRDRPLGNTPRCVRRVGGAGLTRALMWIFALVGLLGLIRFINDLLGESPGATVAREIGNPMDAGTTASPPARRAAPGSDNPTWTPLKCHTCKACSGNMPRIPGTSVQGRVLRKSWTFYSKNWGNVLAPYWAARTVAHLGGYEYQGNVFGRGTWMEHLPTKAPPASPQDSPFQDCCLGCWSYEFFHEGECSGGWGRMAEVIRRDTRDAILKFSRRAPKAENDKVFSFFGPGDWLVYNRCCVMGHRAQAPTVLKMWDSIPAEGAFQVYVMTGRREDKSQLCDELISLGVDRVRARNPRANVRILETASTHVDFARLVFAPNVLNAAVGSSWMLWSAIMANNGTVISPLPMRGADASHLDSHPPSVAILADMPALVIPEQEEAARSYGIPNAKFSNSTEDRAALLRFYRDAKGDEGLA